MSTPVDKKKDMEGETRPLRSSSHELKKSPLDTISILVVDDDTTCLSIVAAILKRFKYEVVTAKHPNDALCTLRIKGGAFNLVVSDVHMPDMNGFELQKAISKEFDLPVVLMSADDKEGNVLKGMENGAAFFLVKPVCEDDLKDLWQFAAMKKKSQVVIEETGSSPVEKTSTDKNKPVDQLTVSASSVNEDKPNPKKDSKRKSPKKEGPAEEKGEHSESSSTKKPKIIWTNSLHNRFLEAIRSIGLDRAVPKKILEIMNVPGLTRENVASHLQKYRIFLRRVSDASSNVQYSSDKGLLSKSIIRPSIASSSITTSTPMLNGINKFQYQNPKQFPNLEPSSSNLVTQLGSGQSRLLCNKGSLLKPNTENTDLVHQNPRSFLGITHNNYLEDLSRALSVSFDGSTSKNPGIDYEVSSYKNNGINANPNPNPSPLIPSKNLTVQTNYVGFRMSNLKELIGGLGTVDKQKGFSSCNSTTNLPTCAPANNRVECETIMTNENINVDQVTQNLGASSSFVPENNNGGDQLSDILADYQMMLPSNVSMFSGVEIGGEINESDFSPLFDLPGSFDIMTNQQPLDEADFNTSFGDQVNMQTQGQINGVETITGSGLFGGTTDWDNNVPSFDPPNQQDWSDLIDSQEFGSSSQLINNTILLPSNEQQIGVGFTNPLSFGTTSQLIITTPQSPTVHDDDDFLESLLAPFGDDQTLEGI